MPTRRLTTGTSDIEAAGALIRRGALVVFPTETVYGLGADATSAAAARSVYKAKGRPADNPLIVHFASRESLLREVTSSVESAPVAPARDAPAVSTASAGTDLVIRRAEALLTEFAPGPVTIVVPRIRSLSPVVSAGLETVALRVPDHPVARRLISAAGRPLAAPSANRSGRPSPTTFAAALAEMDGSVAAIVDGGACAVGIESTVIDISGEIVTVLRPGAVTAEMIRRRCGFEVHDAGSGGRVERSPGTRYRHYSPAMPLLLVEGGSDIESSLRVTPKRVRIMAVSSTLAEACRHACNANEGTGVTVDVVTFANHTDYAAALFAEFFRAERDGIDLILAELPDSAAHPALADRLRRAATA